MIPTSLTLRSWKGSAHGFRKQFYNSTDKDKYNIEKRIDSILLITNYRGICRNIVENVKSERGISAQQAIDASFVPSTWSIIQ